METLSALILIIALFVLLGSGLWIGIVLLGMGMVVMDWVLGRPGGDSMALTVWGSLSAWTLTALPLFLWMGEILVRSKVTSSLFTGLSPWLRKIPGRLLHTNIIGCTLFAAISGSSAATCATVGKVTLPELSKRGYPDEMAVGSLAGAGTLGLLIPPSIIMIVYGVAANVSITKLFIAGVIPGLLLSGLFMGYTMVWGLLNPSKIPSPSDEETFSFKEKIIAIRHIGPVAALIGLVLGSIYSGIATATEAAAIGVAGSLLFSAIDGSLNWHTFIDGLKAGCRLYCMIGLILAGSAFLTLAMGFMGLPRHLAEYVTALQLSPFVLLMILTLFFIILGCFLDGISMVVLTISVLLPTLKTAGYDLIWFGIFIVLVVEMAQITPPVGFNLFVLQSMTKREIAWIAKVALPYFILMNIAVLLIWFFPQIVLWLPGHI